MSLRLRGSYPLWQAFPHLSSETSFCNSYLLNPTTPPCEQDGLGFSAFARHYSRNPFFSSGYLDVSVPQVPFSPPMCSAVDDGGSLHRVSPFGYLRLNACSRLLAAFRSDPRPSSALGAKASTVSPCSFACNTENSILFPYITSFYSGYFNAP
jgi:hypothetical protein